MLHQLKCYHYVYITVFLIFGSCSTLLSKAQFRMNVTAQDGKKYGFDHPFIGNLFMFVGEFLCLIVFGVLVLYMHVRNIERPTESADIQNHLEILVTGTTRYNYLVIVFPACFDLIATAMMFVGLVLTTAPSFQMMRGSVIIFVAVFSKVFLKRTFPMESWIGIGIIMFGLILVGVGDAIETGHEGTFSIEAILGDGLIIAAQLSTATQMVIHEKYVGAKDIPPLFQVGGEGLVGMVIQSILLVPTYYISWAYSHQPEQRLDDAICAYYQLGNDNVLLALFIAFPFVIAVFNGCGIVITKTLSATTRMVLDTMRTIVVWIVSLALQWTKIAPLQPIGFVFMIFGMTLYYDIWPCIRKRRERRELEAVMEADNEEVD